MGLDSALDTLLKNGISTFDANSKIYGVVPALVTAVHEGKQAGRVKAGMVRVYFPWLQKREGEKNLINPWARVVMPNSGKGVGFYTIPQVGDEVVVGFEHGDPQFPYLIGSLYNGRTEVPMPQTDADGEDLPNQHAGKPPDHRTPDQGPDSLGGDKGKNTSYFWRSRTGNMIVLDDKEGTIRIEERTGKSVIQLEKDHIRVLQRTGEGIFVWAKERIRFDCKNFEVHTKDSILMHAKNDWGSLTEKHMTLTANGKLSGTASAEKAANGVQGIGWWAKVDLLLESNMDTNITADKKLLLKTTANEMIVDAMMAVNMTANQPLNVSSQAKINITGFMGANFSTNGEAKIDAGSLVTCKSKRINLN